MKWLATAALGLTCAAACVGNIGGDGKDGKTTVVDEPNLPNGVEAPVGQVQIRLLNAEEYRSTIRDLLDLEASPALTHEDSGSGYDSGAQGKLDENLFAALYDEAERLAGAYVDMNIATDFPCFDPSDVAESCMSTIIEQLGQRSYRRPLSDGERAGLLALYQDIALDSGDGLLAAKSTVTRLLSSLHFLHRSELGERQTTSGEQGDFSVLTSWERASLISYAVLGSMPDQALFDAAAAEALDADGIAEQVRRLLASDKGKERMVHFVRQWLRVDKLKDMAARPEEYPKLTSPEQGQALYDEFRTYVERTIYDGDGTLGALLTGKETYINRHIDSLYDTTIDGDTLQAFALNGDRVGVLSLASTMAAHGNDANVDKDRPVIRGLLIKNKFFCEEVGLPEGIDTATAAMEIVSDLEQFEQLTTREQFETIMNQAEQCQDCHQQFMPLGFTFGNFNALGQFQTMKGALTIDTAVQDIPVKETPMSFSGHLELIDLLATNPIVSACFTENIIAYVTGTARYDVVSGHNDKLHGAYSVESGDVRALFVSLLSSPELYVRYWARGQQEEE